MNITYQMLDFWKLPATLQEKVVARYMEYIKKPKPFTIQSHIRGKSVSGDSPIIIRNSEGEIKVIPIRELFTEKELYRTGDYFQKEVKGIEVWSRNGWVKIKYKMKHRANCKLKRVRVRSGLIDVTPDHSLLNASKPVKVSQLSVNDKIELIELPVIDGKQRVDEDLAWTLGFFLAEGNIRRNSIILTNTKRINFKIPIRLSKKLGLSYSICKDKLEIVGLVEIFNKCFCKVPHNHKRRRAYEKKVPSFVFSWDKKSRLKLLEGYLSGDGIQFKGLPGKIEFASVSQPLLQGMILIVKSIYPELDVSVDWSNPTIRVRMVNPRHNRYNNNRNTIMEIVEAKGQDNRLKKNPNFKGLGYWNKHSNKKIWFYSPRQLVFDLETENNVFSSGVGRILAHNSQHLDWRMRVNDYLIGWSIVGGSVEDPITPEKLLENIGKGFRAETKCFSTYCNEWMFDIYEVDGEFYYTKAEIPHILSIEELARQPLVWLKIEGVIKPGEPGAGIEAPGEFKILAKGQWMSGAQKVWFHEYFLKGGPFEEWTRIVVRAVRVPRLDPVTKKPIPGKYERFWRAMIPKEQMPYAISSRARKEKWRPPRGIIPFPEEWAKKKWPKEYKAWKEWLAEAKSELVAKTIKFTLSLHKYRGPIHIRGLWRLDWYLFLDDKGRGQIRTFNLKGDPLRETLIEAWNEGRDSRKYLTWKGKTKPMSRFNPTKDLYGEMNILDTGKVEYESILENGEERIHLNFKGKLLKGKWILEQEEPGSEAYAFYQTKKFKASLAEVYDYVYHKHYWDDKVHYDLRWKTSDTSKEEFNIYNNLAEAKIEEEIKAVYKSFEEPARQVEYWMVKEGKGIKRLVGDLETYIDVLDSGTIHIIERNPQFISFMLRGKLFKDLIIVARKRDNQWYISKAKLPKALAREGDPRTGSYYKPFIIEQKRGWDYFIVHLYDIRQFTRCEGKEKTKLYDVLTGKIPTGITLGICLYPRPGKIHGARVAYIKFNLDKWNPDEAERWIIKNKLHTWSGIQVRKSKEELQATLYPWVEVKEMDLPDRSIKGTIYTERGPRNVLLRAWTDTLALEIFELFVKGISMFQFKIYGGFITQIVNYKSKGKGGRKKNE